MYIGKYVWGGGPLSTSVIRREKRAKKKSNMRKCKKTKERRKTEGKESI